MKFDYLVVGSGLFGSVFARKMKDNGKSVLVLEKRKHIGGNTYTENVDGIDVHKYGAHIFHTNNEEVWKYINQFAQFNNYIHTVKAKYKDEIYDLPFNMNTFKQMWGISKEEEVIEIIDKQRCGIDNPKNLQEQCISLVGKDIYEKLVKGYTEKQWGKPCDKLPAFIIKRLPVRFEYNNNYFDDIYQGIPKEGYTKLIEKLLEGIEVKLNCNYLDNRDYYDSIANKKIYTGPIDEYYDYCFGPLEYRSIKFEEEKLNISDFQGCSVVNYTDKEVPYTRIIEHKWFKPDNTTDFTIISKEYSKKWEVNEEPYYPINDETNNSLYNKYKELADKDNSVIFGGRLGEYKYYDMDKVIESALCLAKEQN